MSDISEISSSPEDDETGEGEEEDVEVIYSQIRPYQDEPLAEDADENTEENEVDEADEDGLTPLNKNNFHFIGTLSLFGYSPLSLHHSINNTHSKKTNKQKKKNRTKQNKKRKRESEGKEMV